MVEIKSSQIETPLGAMTMLGDDDGVYLLQFNDGRGLADDITRLTKRLQAHITPGQTAPMKRMAIELDAYFAGERTDFTAPIHLVGTVFQKQTWRVLQTIPYGQTCSYLTEAKQVGSPKGYRAVARANATNRLTIVVPCHRVINHNGNLGGYAGGIEKKEWLLNHEKKYQTTTL